MVWAVAIVVALLMGSIPFSLLIGLTRGVDIRTVGSKNVGATNLGRALGGKYFALGFTLDMLKGLVPTLTAGYLAGVLGETAVPTRDAWAWLAVAVAGPLGHMFSPWVGFKGGKGVATGLGAMLGVFPVLGIPAVGALVVFCVVLALWKYVSLASCAAAAALPVFTYMFFGYVRTLAARGAMPEDPLMIHPDRVGGVVRAAESPYDATPFLIVSSALALLVIVKHRGNLMRIIRGEEARIGGTKPAPSVPA